MYRPTIPNRSISLVQPEALAPTTRARTIPRILATTAALVIAIGLALVATSGSYALLNASTTVSAGTISSGAQDVRINGGTSATLTPLTAMYPTKSVITQVTFANHGNTNVSVQMQTTGAANGVAGKDLVGALSQRFAFTTTNGGCAAALTGVFAPVSTTSSSSVSPTITELPASNVAPVLYGCIEIRMNDTAAAAVQSGTANLSYLATVTQVVA